VPVQGKLKKPRDMGTNVVGLHSGFGGRKEKNLFRNVRGEGVIGAGTRKPSRVSLRAGGGAGLNPVGKRGNGRKGMVHVGSCCHKKKNP